MEARATITKNPESASPDGVDATSWTLTIGDQEFGGLTDTPESARALIDITARSYGVPEDADLGL